MVGLFVQNKGIIQYIYRNLNSSIKRILCIFLTGIPSGLISGR